MSSSRFQPFSEEIQDPANPNRELLLQQIPNYAERSCTPKDNPSLLLDPHAPLMSADWEEEEMTKDELRAYLAKVKILARCLEQAPVGIIRCNVVGRVIWANSVFCELFDIDTNSDYGNWVANTAPDDLVRAIGLISKTQADPHSIYSSEVQWRKGKWCELTVRGETDQNGVMTGIIACYQDVTGRKLAEQREIDVLKEREKDAREFAAKAEMQRKEAVEQAMMMQELRRRTYVFEKMAEISTVGLTSTAPGEFTFRWANDAFMRMLDIPPGGDLNQWHSIVDEHRDDMLAKWQVSIETGTSFKNRVPFKNGTVVDSQIVPSNPADPANNTWIAILVDVTAIVAAESAQALLMKETEDRRVAAVEEKDQIEWLVDMVSHETRNTISPILQSGLLIKNSLLELRGILRELQEAETLQNSLIKWMEQIEDDLEAIGGITDSANAQARVSNDILNLAQIQTNNLAIRPVTFSVQESLASIGRMFQAECQSRQIQMLLRTSPSVSRILGPSMMLKADTSRITQVAVNLISNAIRYASQGEEKKVTVDMHVSLEPPASTQLVASSSDISQAEVPDDTTVYLCFTIHDTGPGMTPDQIRRLFSKFGQLSSSSQTGLGLYIAQHLTRLLGGRISVECLPGAGTTFTCYFQGQTSLKPIIALPTPVSPASRRSRRCLAVDDNLINRRILQKQLKAAGHVCDTAEDGIDALRVIERAEREETRYDCIVMDINMPHMNGLDCTMALRKRAGGQAYRIIGVTGQARREQIEGALKSGMDVVLPKPYQLDELLDALDQ